MTIIEWDGNAWGRPTLEAGQHRRAAIMQMNGLDPLKDIKGIEGSGEDEENVTIFPFFFFLLFFCQTADPEIARALSRPWNFIMQTSFTRMPCSERRSVSTGQKYIENRLMEITLSSSRIRGAAYRKHRRHSG